MNIVIFSHDLPWPAVHGGRIDMYNRIKAFKELNHKVFFVCWALHEDNKRQENISHVANLVDGLVCFLRKEDFFNRAFDIAIKIAKLVIQPNLVTQCSLNKSEFLKLKDQIQIFSPDVVFVENIYAAKLAYKYASAMHLPIFIRSHNIEHIYIRQLAVLSRTLKMKIKFLAMTPNLKRYENQMLRKADAFFDISLSDLEFWKLQGLTNGYWMPPVYYKDNNVVQGEARNSPDFDIAYIGNLKSPNNVEGIFWFLKEIFPLVLENHPNTKLLIAGSVPIRKLYDYCSENKNITLIANPSDTNALYLRTKVLINPLRFGSGVNIKTIEMLHLGKPVVCTSKAIQGLPKEMESIFEIADDAAEFAFKILKCLPEGTIAPSRNLVMDYFNPNYLKINIERMEKFCQIVNKLPTNKI